MQVNKGIRPPLNEWSEAYGLHQPHIKSTVREGMSARQLIEKLKKMTPDAKVVVYDKNGNSNDIICAIQENKNEVGLF